MIALPCSINRCENKGTRLFSSLKMNYNVKKNSSGKICEGHYRKDLRKFRELGLINDSSIDSFSKDLDCNDNGKFMCFCNYVLKNESKL